MIEVGDHVWLMSPSSRTISAELGPITDVRPVDGGTCIQVHGTWFVIADGAVTGIEADGHDGASRRRWKLRWSCALDCPEGRAVVRHSDNVKRIMETIERVDTRKITRKHADELADLLLRIVGLQRIDDVLARIDPGPWREEARGLATQVKALCVGQIDSVDCWELRSLRDLSRTIAIHGAADDRERALVELVGEAERLDRQLAERSER